MLRNKEVNELRNNMKVFADLLSNATQQDVLFRPATGKWNLLEIACHLLDEERLDFRARMKHILYKPDEEMPGIDPEGWVSAHKYSERDFRTVVDDFLNEREMSLEWLDTLTDDDLRKSYEHKIFGKVTADHFLLNWLAHDYLHMRQIVALKYNYLKNKEGADLRYAGDW